MAKGNKESAWWQEDGWTANYGTTTPKIDWGQVGLSPLASSSSLSSAAQQASEGYAKYISSYEQSQYERMMNVYSTSPSDYFSGYTMKLAPDAIKLPPMPPPPKPAFTKLGPDFPGWEEVSQTERLEEGDVIVATGKDSPYLSSWPDPERGLPVDGQYEGSSMSTIAPYPHYKLTAYRPDDTKPKTLITNQALRKLGPNKEFAEPLPLP